MRKQTGATLLAAGAALLAHVPCCGPTVLLAFGGASAGAGVLHWLEPYRPWLLGFSFLTLGIGFWLAYRKPHACHCSATCDTDAHAKRRVRIGATWVVAALVGAVTVAQLLQPHTHHHYAMASDGTVACTDCGDKASADQQPSSDVDHSGHGH